MDSIDVLPARALPLAVSMMLEAKALLALARLNLKIAQQDVKLVIDRLNELYRERRACRAEARFMRDTEVKNADWEEASSILFSMADALEDVYWDFERREYYRAYEIVWRCQSELKSARKEAREAEKYVYDMIKAHKAGLLVDDGLLDPDGWWNYDDPDYDDYVFDWDDEFGYIDHIADARAEAAWKAEERIEEVAERTDRKLRTKKADERRRSRRSKKRDVNWRRD